MYIVVEKSEGRLYAYCEDAVQFKRMEKEYRKSLKKLTPQTLDDECDLSDMPNNAYIPFKLATRPPKKAAKPKKGKACGGRQQTKSSSSKKSLKT